VTVTLPDQALTEVLGFLLVVCRVGGLFVLAPGFSSAMIPSRVKLMLAMALALAMLPIAVHGQTVPLDAGDYVTLMLKEIGVGLIFAFPMALVGAAVQSGASLLDTLIGFSFSAVLDPVNNQQTAILGQFYSLFAVLVLLMSGGDQIMIEGIGASYRALPITAFPHIGALTAGSLAAFSQVWVIGLEIAAPVLVALVITDAAIGLVSRAVPQMNVFVVGLPAKILVGMTVIAATLPFVSNQVQGALQQSVMQAVQTLGG
jgi:flagellar biosynthetic protein FliR